MTNPINLDAQVSIRQRDQSQQHHAQKTLQQIPPGSAAAAAVRQPMMEELLKPVQRVNDVLRAYGVNFELSQQHDRVITRLIDMETGDLIRQIPSEAVLKLASQLEAHQQGIILDESV